MKARRIAVLIDGGFFSWLAESAVSNLIDWIESQMMSDDEDRTKQSRRLRDLYEAAPPEGRQVLDDALICLCGYSFQRALSSSHEDQD